MRRLTLLAAILCPLAAMAQERPVFDREVDFRDMTSAEQTAARQEARRRHFDEIRFCADPGNMPLSNNRAEGFENKIAEAVGRRMGARVTYFWRPFLERGLTRQAFENKQCDVVIETPSGYEHVLTSMPIYRSTYVFATREDAGFTIDGFDDPDLRTHKVGVYQHSGMREALARHGIKKGLDLHLISYDADLQPEKQPWNQVRRMAEGALDIAAVWGPFAGWVKAQGAPIRLTPANLMEDKVKLEFDIAFGVRSNDVVLKYALDFALLDAADEIEGILRSYGVPLVACPACVVSGDLPSHGSYFDDIIERAQERFTSVEPQSERRVDAALASPDQIMSVERVRKALDAGADPLEEFHNAVLASDIARVAYLLDLGVDVNAPDKQGAPAIVTAARNRDPDMMAYLTGHGARVDARDAAGMTALHNAVLRNHAPSVAFLAGAGADLGAEGYEGMTPLALAITEGMRWAAQALIDAGADVNQRFGKAGLTPLMALSTQDAVRNRSRRVTGGPSVVEIAEALVRRGADVNAVTRHGVSALMIAAGGDHNDMLAFLIRNGADAGIVNDQGRKALDVAEIARSPRAAQALRVLTQ